MFRSLTLVTLAGFVSLSIAQPGRTPPPEPSAPKPSAANGCTPSPIPENSDKCDVAMDTNAGAVEGQILTPSGPQDSTVGGTVKPAQVGAYTESGVVRPVNRGTQRPASAGTVAVNITPGGINVGSLNPNPNEPNVVAPAARPSTYGKINLDLPTPRPGATPRP
jgi:hypothetical protein